MTIMASKWIDACTPQQQQQQHVLGENHLVLSIGLEHAVQCKQYSIGSSHSSNAALLNEARYEGTQAPASVFPSSRGDALAHALKASSTSGRQTPETGAGDPYQLTQAVQQRPWRHKTQSHRHTVHNLSQQQQATLQSPGCLLPGQLPLLQSLLTDAVVADAASAVAHAC